MFNRVRIILVAPSHPGNIGSAARAMKTMGLQRLYLVEPKAFPHSDAKALSVGASDVLDNARICDSLEEALNGTVFSVAATARHRDLSHQTWSPREVAASFTKKTIEGDVAIVFGPERTGLSIEDATKCNVVSTIPCNPDYSSLNLAQAVQVFAYELKVVVGDYPGSIQNEKVLVHATHDEIERLIEHFEKVLIDLEFLNVNNPGRVVQRLRRLIARSELEKEELNILRGFLSAVEKKAL
ncbi:RNA methyltransferase [Burkholderiales bacterium]|jgi:tRNA/rRNA methyltransferase|nr:RNA methyltransferase [Betaproteobacteria bacterium]MBT6185207.1 RNA methyltransferase [Betaproteobacteria bacterium]MBT6531340.1 RNA methyltransferase [Betaproteobacteria bacterium]MBT7996980.1 RNA methyltransferase [Betaproteobacteria bacterium]MDA9295735.1 RNA methyltransferase [Burkholderiales bacterium]